MGESQDLQKRCAQLQPDALFTVRQRKIMTQGNREITMFAAIPNPPRSSSGTVFYAFVGLGLMLFFWS